MTVKLPQKLLDVNAQWAVPATGRPSPEFFRYMTDVDRVVRAFVAMGTPTLVANLPASSLDTKGDIAFASNGRANGESAGHGTGVLVFNDGTAWRASDTGVTVAA